MKETGCPFRIAVKLMRDGEEGLRRRAGSRQVLSAWRQRGVPWSHIGPLLYKLVRREGLLQELLDSRKVEQVRSSLEDVLSALPMPPPLSSHGVGHMKRSAMKRGRRPRGRR